MTPTSRLQTVRQQFDEWEIDALLISSAANRRWLSGFTGSAGTLVITPEKAILATDSRYWEQAKQQAPDFELFASKTPDDTAVMIKDLNAPRIGVEAAHTTLAQMAKLKQQIEGVTWIALGGTVERWRQSKSVEEIRMIRTAVAITDQIMAQVNRLARPGISERALAWELEKRMRENGADSVAFPVIVASGPNSALPHHTPGDRLLQAGDVLIVDMGARRDGYHSDLTRSFYLGDAPTDRFWQVYNLVLAAQTAVFENARPGMKSEEVDKLARTPIHDAGHEAHFGHGLGHGLGLSIHEDPWLTQKGKKKETEIVVGTAVTIEPGIYIPGWGGVRIEDLAHVTEDRFISLSQCPKTPIIPIRDT